MNNYRKGKNVEEPLDKNKIPIEGLPEKFIWMQVRGGSKIRNLLSHALEEFPKEKHVVWTGFGTSVGKAVTCAEIMKKEWDNSLHQITKICYRTIEEYWDPVLPELDQLVVKRKLPMIHIYLSMEPVNKAELGFQGPGETTPYKLSERNFQEKKEPNHKLIDKRGHTLEEFVSHKLTEGSSNKKSKYKSKDKKTLLSEKVTTLTKEDIGEPTENESSGDHLSVPDANLSYFNDSNRSQGHEDQGVSANHSKKNKKHKFQGQPKPKNFQDTSDSNISFKSKNNSNSSNR